MTSGNYDEKGRLIEEQVPTLTTDFCEIGIYNENVCYLTFILYSEFSINELFNALRNYKNIHIYGFKNFFKDYYPANNFSFTKLSKQIQKEPYFQIQFNFNPQEMSPEGVFKAYLGLKDIFISHKAKIVNQITHKF